MSRRMPALLAGAVAATLALAGCSAPTEPAASPSASAGPGAAGAYQDPIAAEPAVPAGTPVRIDIPAIGVSSTLEDLGLGGGGELLAPVDYSLAGWYTAGAVPGDVGPAIIAGHIDSAIGPAVFERLPELAVGDTITVTDDAGGTLTFEMYGSSQSAKATFPTSDVYGAVPAPELRLITCEGTFDESTGHYTDNLVVFARLVR